MVELLLDEGLDGLTIDKIARTAGVGRQTIYRRWRSKDALVQAVVASDAITIDSPLVANTGDLRADLTEWVVARAEVWSGRWQSQVIRAQVIAAASDPGAAQAIYARFVEREHATLVERLTAARDVGQLNPGVDVEAATELILGANAYLTVIRTRSLTSERARAQLEVILAGLLAR